jgi:predicted RNA binding protein YcfA (HicA-like mRNA interferase family)
LADLPALPHLRVVRAFERAGFRVLRQGKHVVMTDGEAVITIPRHNPVNRWTLAGIIKEAGLTVDAFRKLC